MPSTEPTWVRKFFERKAISSLSRKFFTKHCDCIKWSFTLTRSWALTGIWFCVRWSMEKWGDFEDRSDRTGNAELLDLGCAGKVTGLFRSG